MALRCQWLSILITLDTTSLKRYFDIEMSLKKLFKKKKSLNNLISNDSFLNNVNNDSSEEQPLELSKSKSCSMSFSYTDLTNLSDISDTDLEYERYDFLTG